MTDEHAARLKKALHTAQTDDEGFVLEVEEFARRVSAAVPEDRSCNRFLCGLADDVEQMAREHMRALRRLVA